MKALIVFVKYPQPGKVKTRLGAEIGVELAAELYELFIHRTFELCQQTVADEVFVAFEPKELQDEFRRLFPSEFRAFPQEGSTLGQRLQNAFKYAFSKKADKVIAIGSDSPTLPTNYIDQAFNRLDFVDLVVGPAEDGGYYLIGSNELQLQLFEKIEWSSSSVFESTVQRAKKLQLTYEVLPLWYDVDDLASLKRAIKDDESGKIASYLSQHSQTL